MFEQYQIYEFPQQKIPKSKKNKTWAAQCCDWVIAQGVAIKDSKKIQQLSDILNGEIPDEMYRKILNPYNSKQEKYTRFPATLRNYDLIKGNIRRFIGEYTKNPHTFIVGANNPEVILAKNNKLKEELSKIIQQQIAQQIQQAYQQFIQEGNDPSQFNPQEVIDVEKFTKEFNENYIDEISAQGQAILEVIQDITDDKLFYNTCYFNFIAYGETYSYSDIENGELIKRAISPIDAYPIPTDSMFIEDDDMFACRRKLSYAQILDEFEPYLDDKDLEYLERYYNLHDNATNYTLSFDDYRRYYPDVCQKYSIKERELFKKGPILRRDDNPGLFDVWHTVWRGYARQCIITYIDAETQMISTRTELEGYKLNKELGDISIEYIYVPQVYECVRIGGRDGGIYPYSARAIAFDRNGKLPYNGICELLPGFGKFSIIEIVSPYQIFYNIVSYHREMAIAKNKLSVLLLAKSLLGKVPEDTIYKMLADGVLYIDDTEDQGMLRAQQVRAINVGIGDYITQLSNLLSEIKAAAMEQVDMTPQRYGEIATSAGKATTQQAIARGSMGSVIVEFSMDRMRERDYARDMDYTKLAWIDGLNTSYRDANNDLKYISLNVDNHLFADYIIKAKNSTEEYEKLEQMKQLAFNASQNGDMEMAVAAITGDNIASINKLIKEFQEKKTQNEQYMKQMDQQLEQMKQQFELQKIQVKGEEDRKTVELEGYIKKEIELIRADANMISYNAEVGMDNKEAGIDRLNAERSELEREKLKVAREKNILDAMSKERDRKVKEKDIDAKIQIAKENKNRYDVKGKK